MDQKSQTVERRSGPVKNTSWGYFSSPLRPPPDPQSRRFWARILTASVALHLIGYLLFTGIIALGKVEVKIPVKFRLVEPPPPSAAMFQMTAPAPQKAMTLRKQIVPSGKPMVRRQVQEGEVRFRGLGGGNSEFARYSSGLTGTRLAVPEPSVGSGTGIGEAGAVVEIAPAVVTSFKEPEKRISMQEEFLDLQALDTGKYKGLVIQDPADKRNIKGFIYLAQAIANEIDPPTARAIPQLAEALNRHTQINAQVERRLPLDSRDIFKAPFVYISERKGFNLTEQEAHNLGDYLRNGGFALVDNAAPLTEFGPGEASLRKMLRDALGKDARLRVIPRDHPLYHCFFDFDDGPPPGGEVSGSGDRGPLAPDLEGIFLNERLVAVYSDKGYGAIWELEFRNEAQLKMGINLIVFALTQQGSIAQQQIDYYSGR